MRDPIPYDVVLEIARYLSPSAILNLSLASHDLCEMLTSSLYRTLILQSSNDCKVILKMLLKRKDICGHIRELVVRPNYYQAWPRPDKRICEVWVANAIKKLSRHLKALYSFGWDGLELPDDSLWSELRSNCVKLKSISASVGMQPLNPESSLFAFSNLTAFSLIVRHGIDGTSRRINLVRYPVFEQTPPRLWDMLLKRCPGLQRLTLCSFSPSGRALDFERIVEGRWPRLNSLLLGPFGYQSNYLVGPLFPSTTNSFGRFLSNHSSLNDLQLHWEFKIWASPENVKMNLSPSALSALKTFTGTYHQLEELPHATMLRKIDIACDFIYSEGRLDRVSQVLARFRNLTTLNISLGAVDLSSRAAHLFFSVLSALPKLTDLILKLSVDVSLRPLLKELPHKLALIRPLRRFTLVKSYKYTQFPDAMLRTALRIIKQVHQLEQIDMRWERYSAHCIVQKGTYGVVVGRDGRPEALMVVEQGMPLIGESFLRRYRCGIVWKETASAKSAVFVP